MRRLLWLPVTALLVFGCEDAPDKVTAPDGAAEAEAALASVANADPTLTASGGARCVQLRYTSETGITRTAQRGTGCSCVPGRPVSVTATIWNGAAGNKAIGGAGCTSAAAITTVAGPAEAVDPGAGLFGVASSVGKQGTGVPVCALVSITTNSLDRPNRLVTCVWH
jgi:hypothetical protein